MPTAREVLNLPLGRLQLLTVDLLERLATLENAAHEPIAVIGMAGRYPGSGGSLAGFWQLLLRRQVVAPARRDDDPRAVPCTLLDDAADFDPGFFGLNEREALFLDPQQRLMFEVAWQALEDAGRPPEQMPLRTGVFLGLCSHDYAELLGETLPESSGWLVQGSSHGIAAGRLSRLFGFQGPSMSLDSACASSMLAAHMALRALRERSCDAALVGGASVMATARVGRDLADAGLLSSSGHCRPFDARADGYLRGEGCGVMVFKRLSDALRDGDRIRGLIRGSAANHDGKGLQLAPSSAAQKRAIADALADARMAPADVDVVEASSIGAYLADPVEAAALVDSYGAARGTRGPLAVGSLKSNIGHLEAGAGVAALSKAVLMLEQGRVPGHADFEQANPHLEWPPEQVTVVRENLVLPGLRHVAVSGFALSGTNVHVVLERAPALAAETPVAGPHLLALSAPSEAALDELQAAVVAAIQARPQDLPHLGYTLLAGRRGFAWRRTFVVADAEDALRQLAAPSPARCAESAPAVALWLPAEVPTAGETREQALARQAAAAQRWIDAGLRPVALAGAGLGQAAAALAAGRLTWPAAQAWLKGEAVTLAEPGRFPLVSPRSGRPLQRSELHDVAACLAGTLERRAVDWPAGTAEVLDTGESFAPALARLFVAGAELNWRSLLAGRGLRIADAPATPMQRRRFWPPRPLGGTPSAEDAAIDALARRLKQGDLPPEEVAPALLDLVRQTLHIDDLRSDQSLLDVGATSVDLLQAITRIERATGFRPRVEDVFGEPTVDGMVRLYEDWRARQAEPVPEGQAELRAWLARLAAGPEGRLPYITPLDQPLVDLLLVDTTAPGSGWHYSPAEGGWEPVALDDLPPLPGAAWAVLLVAATEPLAELALSAPARAAADTEAAAIVQLLLSGPTPGARWHAAAGEVQADGQPCTVLQVLLVGTAAAAAAAPAPQPEEEALEGGWL